MVAAILAFLIGVVVGMTALLFLVFHNAREERLDPALAARAACPAPASRSDGRSRRAGSRPGAAA
jgi:hypothetical protein